jgi:hypothetical protein
VIRAPLVAVSLIAALLPVACGNGSEAQNPNGNAAPAAVRQDANPCAAIGPADVTTPDIRAAFKRTCRDIPTLSSPTSIFYAFPNELGTVKR